MISRTVAVLPVLHDGTMDRIAANKAEKASEANEASEATVGSQLRLVVGGREIAASARDWVLDDRTRMVGRYGISQVRATLRQHRPAETTDSLAS